MGQRPAVLPGLAVTLHLPGKASQSFMGISGPWRMKLVSLSRLASLRDIAGWQVGEFQFLFSSHWRWRPRGMKPALAELGRGTPRIPGKVPLKAKAPLPCGVAPWHLQLVTGLSERVGGSCPPSAYSRPGFPRWGRSLAVALAGLCVLELPINPDTWQPVTSLAPSR